MPAACPAWVNTGLVTWVLWVRAGNETTGWVTWVAAWATGLAIWAAWWVTGEAAWWATLARLEVRPALTGWWAVKGATAWATEWWAATGARRCWWAMKGAGEANTAGLTECWATAATGW